MALREQKIWYPAWLELSGLPQHLLAKTKNSNCWAVFKKIVELDCSVNSMPGTVEISLLDLESLSGVKAEGIRKASLSLRKLKLVACFLPDNDEEAALFRVVTPLETPRTPKDIQTDNPHLFEEGMEFYRYVSDCDTLKEEEVLVNDPDLRQTVDLYFDVIGLKMNAFILDELRMLPQRFKMQEIQSVFRMARKNEIRSLNWVIRELVRRRSKQEPSPENLTQKPFEGIERESDIQF